MKKSLKKHLPAPVSNVLQKVYNFVGDNYELISGQRDALTPPRRLIFVGPGDFKRIGQGFLQHFITIGNLRPDEHVLDVGCGIGRMALPLTTYLSKNGRYEGFDIVPKGIDWCRKKITPRYNNFHFQVADIKNARYNPGGKFDGSSYRFPYEDNSFDFVFLTSVFTHLPPPDVENYLAEIARVMRSGARCLITFFLLNTEADQLIDAGKGDFTFMHRYENHAINSTKSPANAVAYKEQYIRDLFEQHKLVIQEPIHYGCWSGRDEFLDYQDIIVAKK